MAGEWISKESVFPVGSRVAMVEVSALATWSRVPSSSC